MTKKKTINFNVICSASGNKGMQFYTNSTTTEGYTFRKFVGTWSKGMVKILDKEFEGKTWLYVSAYLKKNLPHYKLTSNKCVLIGEKNYPLD